MEIISKEPFIVDARTQKKVFKILSIDGGGIKGLFSAQVLAKFEEVYKTKTSDHFDLICGTSTGGIIALAISLKIPMSDICKFYLQYGNDIFNEKAKKTKYGRLSLRCNQIFGKGKYKCEALNQALTNVFGQKTMSESHNLLCIPSYNIITGQPRVFKKNYDVLSEDDNKSYVDVALATAAAPTYFPVRDINKERFIDGGVWANNPTLVGLTEYISKFNKEYNSVEILSISSLELPSGEDYNKPLHRSFIHWQDTLFDTFTAGQSFFTNFFMENLSKSSSIPIKYKRIKNDALSSVQQNSIDMDNAAVSSLSLLENIGKTTGVKYKDDEDIKRLFSTKKTYFTQPQQ